MGDVYRCPRLRVHDSFEPLPDGSCALCASEGARRRAESAEQVEQLRTVLRDHVRGFRDGERWEGCDFGRALVGNMLLGALRDLGQDPAEELRAACEAVGLRPPGV